MNITLKDTLGNVIDVLYNGPFDSTTSFKNLSAKNYHGGKVIIDIEAKKGLVVIYSVERGYDASKGGNQGQVVLVAPNMAVDFKSLSLRIREGDVVALPEVLILPADLGNKGLHWFSRAPHILEVAGQTLKALLPGKATLVVRLSIDSTRADSLEVEVISKTDPIKPIEALHLSPDTLRLALKGPDGRFTVRPTPSTASPAAAWTSLNPTLFSVDSTGLLKPLSEGLGRIHVLSKLDAAVFDTAFVLVLPPQKVDSVRFQKAATDLIVGGAAESLTVQVHPPLANPAVALSVEDASLIEVAGLSIRGLKEGETRVFARSVEDPTMTDTLAVVLFPAERVDSVRLKQDSVKLYVRGESQALSATIHPATLQPRFLWRSADSKVVTVDAQGRLSPGTAGKAFVSVTARADAQKRDSALVIVKLDMPRLQVGQDTIVSAGITLTHRPVVTQEYGLVVMFKWDLNGDGTFEDSSATVPTTLAFLYSEIKDYKPAFYVRDTEGNDTVYHRQVKTVTGRVVQITSPKDGSYTNQTTIPVSWTVDGQPLSNTQALNPRANTVTREARDSAGKVFSHTITVHLDQTPPNRPTVKTSLLPVNTLTPGWTWVSGGGGGNATYRYRLDNPDMAVTTVTTDTFFTAPTNLTEGSHTLYVQERDEAGNWSASGNAAVRIDTTAPAAPGVTVSPSGSTNETRPTWSWTGGAGDAHRYYRFKFGNDDFRSGGKDTTGTSLRPTAALPEGVYTLYVQARDSAGNWSASGSATVTIDTQGPTAPTVIVAATLTNDPTPTWTWATATLGAVTFRYKFDANLEVGATVTTDKSFTPTSNLAEGSHTLYVQERDAAGNWSASGLRQVRIDVTPPSAPSIDSIPLSPLNTKRPRWSWKGGIGGARVYRFQLDQPDLSNLMERTDTSYSPIADIPEGIHTLYLQEKDSAGNWSPISSRSIVLSIRGLVGKQDFHDLHSNSSSLHFDNSGSLYLAAYKQGLYRFDGSNWVALNEVSAEFPQVATSISKNGGIFSVALGSTRGVYPKTWTGSKWVELGDTAFFSSRKAGAASIVSHPTGLFMAYSDSANEYKTSIQVFDGSFWRWIGSSVGPAFVKYLKIVIGSDGTPFLCIVAQLEGGNTVSIYKLQGQDWIQIDDGNFADLTRGQGQVSFEISPLGIPHIALLESKQNYAFTVLRYEDNKWSIVGNRGISPGAYYVNPAISFDSSGNLFVAFLDKEARNEASVMRFNGQVWTYVGKRGISGSGVYDVELSVNPLGVPFVLFELDVSEKASVVKTSFDP